MSHLLTSLLTLSATRPSARLPWGPPASQSGVSDSGSISRPLDRGNLMAYRCLRIHPSRHICRNFLPKIIDVELFRARGQDFIGKGAACPNVLSPLGRSRSIPPPRMSGARAGGKGEGSSQSTLAFSLPLDSRGLWRSHGINLRPISCRTRAPSLHLQWQMCRNFYPKIIDLELFPACGHELMTLRTAAPVFPLGSQGFSTFIREVPEGGTILVRAIAPASPKPAARTSDA